MLAKECVCVRGELQIRSAVNVMLVMLLWLVAGTGAKPGTGGCTKLLSVRFFFCVVCLGFKSFFFDSTCNEDHGRALGDPPGLHGIMKEIRGRCVMGIQARASSTRRGVFTHSHPSLHLPRG